MKWSKKKAHTPKKETYYRTAKKKHCKAICSDFYVGDDEYFYYTINGQDYEYNSFTHGDVYKMEDECMAAAEKHIDDLRREPTMTISQFIKFVESCTGNSEFIELLAKGGQQDENTHKTETA